jgi:hypothetical protein
MSRKAIGLTLIGLASLILAVLLMQRAFFPHILGPITLMVIGTVVLATKNREGKSTMNNKRIALVLGVIAAVFIIGILLNQFLPSVTQQVINMHTGN